MRKIPTIFERDWNDDLSRVVDKVHSDCQWVLDGEGVATLKQNGTCCMVRGGKLYKRRELREGDLAPDGFEEVGHDEETRKVVGWVAVGDGPDDRWHREALAEEGRTFPDGTYELLGPKIQGNPERASAHTLIPHGVKIAADAPRTFDGLRDWLAGQDMEGVVFHHPDGRMAKIKLRDFGHKRKAS